MVLSANPVKFQLLTINPRNVDTDNYNQDISVDGHVIERKGKIKPLGVQIDEKLNFTSHTSELCTEGQSKSRGPSAVDYEQSLFFL